MDKHSAITYNASSPHLDSLIAALEVADDVLLTSEDNKLVFHHQRLGLLGDITVVAHHTIPAQVTTRARQGSMAIKENCRVLFNPIARRVRALLSARQNALQCLPLAHDFKDLPYRVQTLDCPSCAIRLALFAHVQGYTSMAEFKRAYYHIAPLLAIAKVPTWVLAEQANNEVWLKLANVRSGNPTRVSVDNVCRMIAAKSKHHCCQQCKHVHARERPSHHTISL